MKEFFTEASLKKLVVLLVVLMGGAGIGSYAVYQYNLQQKLVMTEAKTELLRNQLKINQQNDTLPAAEPQAALPVPADNSAAGQTTAAGTPVTQLGHSVIVNRSDLISVDRAKEIAAATIGVGVDKLVVYDIELDNKNGKVKYKHGYTYSSNPHYMLKCSANALYYKIKIDAVDGRVLEVDIDD